MTAAEEDKMSDNIASNVAATLALMFASKSCNVLVRELIKVPIDRARKVRVVQCVCKSLFEETVDLFKRQYNE